ncbi:polymorphic toxin-type HINT domain-containing protein [Clostridium sp. LP20]|uniref:polymorphic toxin-type HINT domain-containing protein n=1 Tax=Clostridium sp. LP20 TaxID=3418665 RepID=UPI003EE72949
MKKIKSFAIILLMSFIVTTFQSAFPALAIENSVTSEVKQEEKESLTKEEKILEETVRDNPKYKKVRVPYINGVENTNEGLKITWDKVEGANYEIEVDGKDIKSINKDKTEFTLKDENKLNKYINFRVRSEVNGEKSNWSSNYGGYYNIITSNLVARAAWVDTQNGIVDLDTGEMVERFREPDSYTTDLENKTVTLKKNNKGYKIIGSFRLYNLTIDPGVTVYFESKEPLAVTGNLKIGDKGSEEKVNLIRNINEKPEDPNKPSWYGPMISIWKIDYNDSRKVNRSIENCNIVDKLTGAMSEQTIVVKDVAVSLENNTIVSQAAQAIGVSNNVQDSEKSLQRVIAKNNKIITSLEGLVIKGAYVNPKEDNKPEVSVLIDGNIITSDYKGITFAEVYNNPLITEYKVQNNKLYSGNYTNKALEGLDLSKLSNLDEKVNGAIKISSESGINNQEAYKTSEGIKIDIKNYSYAICSITSNTVRNYKTAIVNTNGKLSYTDNTVFNAVEGIRTTIDEFYIGTVSNFFGTNTFNLNADFSPDDDGNKLTPIGVGNYGEGLLKIDNSTIKMNSNGIAVNNEGVLQLSGLAKITGSNGDSRGAYNSNNSVGILNCSSSAYTLISRTYVSNFNVAVKNTNGDIITSGLDSRETYYPIVAIAAKEGFRGDSALTIVQSNLIKKNNGGFGVNIINEGFKLVDGYSIYFEKMNPDELDSSGNFIYPKRLDNVSDAIVRSCYVGKDKDSYQDGIVTIDNLIYDEPIDIETADELIDLTDQIPNYGLYRSFGNEGNDPATGSFGKKVEDFNSVFKYFDYNLSRSYNSLDDREPGVLGRGWRFSFQGSVEELTVEEGKTKIKQVTLPNGSIVTFKVKEDKDKNVTFEALDSRNKLSKNGDGYVLITKEKLKYYFNDKGLLNQIVDRNGNTLNTEFNDDKTIKKIIDMRGSELEFNYSKEGPKGIESVVEKINGKEIKRTNYQVVSENGSSLLKKFTNSYGKNFYYDYDSNNQLTAIRTDSETLEQINYNKDKKVNYHIDINDNKLSYEYDTGNRQTVITDSKGFKIIERYDINNQETFTSYSDGTTVITTYQLDEGKNKYGEVRTQKDRSGISRSFERDDRGNVVKELVNSKVIKAYGYDEKDNKIVEKDYLDNTNALRTFYDYDSKGNVIREITPKTFDTADYTNGQNLANYILKNYTYEDKVKAKGVLKAETDAKGTIEYTYDDRGNLATEIDQYGAKTSYKYNDLDLIAEETQQNGNKIKSYYDINSNLIKKVVEIDPFKSVEEKRAIPDVVERSEFDNEGNKVKEVYGDLYDSSKDKVAIDDTNKIYSDDSYTGDSNVANTYYKNNKVKSEVRKVSDKENYKSEFKYDVYGNIGEEIKANGAKYTYIGDDQGRILESYIEENGKNVLLEKISYQYTGDGGYTKTNNKYIDGSKSLVTKTTYNYMDKEIEVVNPEGAVNKKEYDLQGNITREVDSRNYETLYKYNGQNKVQSIYKNVSNYKDSNGAEKKNYQTTYYSYDDLDNVVEKKKGKYDSIGADDISSSLYVEKYIRKYNTSTKEEEVTTQYGSEEKGVFTQDKNSGKKEIFNYNGNKVKEELTYEAGKVKTIEYVNTLNGKVREKTERVLESDILEDGSNSKEIKLTTSYLFDKRGQVTDVISHSDDSYKGMSVKYGYDYQGRQTETTTIDNSKPSESISSSKTYNMYNDVVTSTDGNKNKIINEYDMRGRLSKVRYVKANNQEDVTAYEYDNADRLIREVAAGNYISGKALNTLPRTEYKRDNVGRILVEVQIGETNSADVNAKTTEYKNKTVVTKAYEYDGNGNVIKEVEGNNLPEVTTADNYLSSIDDLKAKIKSVPGKEIRYYGDNQVESFISPENQKSSSIETFNGIKCDEKYVYDGLGNLRSLYKGDKSSMSYNYDLFGNVTTVIISKSGKRTTMQINKYDGLSRLIETEDGDGYKTKLTYNNFDKVKNETYEVEKGKTETKTNIYDPMANLTKWKNTEGKFEEYVYDAYGRNTEKRVGNEDGSVTVNKVKDMDSNGNIKVMIDGENNITEANYDEKNRPTDVSTSSKEGIKHVKKYNYDPYGNVLSEEQLIVNQNQNESVSKKVNEYDNFGKLIKEKNASGELLKEYGYQTGTEPVIVKEGKSNTTIFEYDKNNRIISETDGVGDRKTYSYTLGDSKIRQISLGERRNSVYDYDERGNLTSVAEHGGRGNGLGSLGLLRRTRYEYDNRGNLIKQAEGANSNYEEYTAEKITKYDYNGLNKVTTKIYDDESKEIYSYFSNGTLKESIDKMGSITSYEYDKTGSLRKRTVKDRDKKLVDEISYTNDNLGNVEEVTNTLNNGVKEVVREYDGIGRITSEKTTDKDSKDNNSISKEYDILVDHKDIYKDAVVAEKTVTSNNTIISKAYDKNGRLKYVIDGDINDSKAKIIGNYSYSDNNRISTLEYGDKSTIEYSYYNDFNINTITNKDGSKNILETYQYTYDDTDRPTTLTKTKEDVKEVERYGYDGLNRLYSLVEETHKDNEVKRKKTTFEYNIINDMVKSVESRLENTGYTPVYQTDYEYTNHRLTKQKNSNLADNTGLETKFIYDANGNLCTSTNGNETKTYGYDRLNRLISANVDGNLVKYGYNGLDKKVSKTLGNDITSLIYDGDNAVEEVLNDKLNGTTYYGDKALYRNDLQNEQKYYYFYNTHNDVTDLRLNGQTKTSYKYDAFGKEVGINGQGTVKVNNPIRYAGYYYEEDSNLYYLNARMYNPDTKRFMQQDTVIGDIQDPNTLNLYAYSGNNPIINYDPTGHWFETFLDVVSLGMSIRDFVKEPSLLNFGMLAWDVVSLVPGVPGSYVAKGFKYADDIHDGVKAADRIHDGVNAIDNIHDGVNAIDNIHDGLKAADGVTSVAKQAENIRDLSVAAKGGKELLQETAKQTMKHGDDLIKDGRVIASSARKAAEKSRAIMSQVKTKVSSIKSKISSTIKSKMDKIKAVGGSKVDNIKTNIGNKVQVGKAKTEIGWCNTKKMVGIKSSCFTPDTLVKTDEGLKPIGELKEGDKVYSVDEDSVDEDSSLKDIKEVKISETDTLVKLQINGEEIKTTKTHPIYVEGKGFIDAEYIVAGDRVRTAEGEIEEVTSKEIETLESPIKVYNLEVEDNRTYYVGSNEVLVHNDCDDATKLLKSIDERKALKGSTKAPISQMTNEELIQEVARRAENKIGGTGRVAGTKKHAYSQKLIDRYQSMFGDRGLRTETTWLGGNAATYGTKGSARIDVLDTINNTAYDYKFTIRPGKGLSKRQTNKIFNNGPSYLQYVKEVNP